MRVLLINLSNFEPCWMPLNLLMLWGTLDEHGIECKIVDENIIGMDGIIREVCKDYDIIGMSITTHQRWDVFDMTQRIRRISPQTKVVYGGVHATVMPEQCLKYADLIVKGDGEGAFLDICQGKPLAERTIPMDDLPIPPWAKFNLWDYPGKGHSKHDKRKVRGIDIARLPRVSIQTSRSCRSHCRFCSSFWVQGQYRQRTPCKVVDEMEVLVSLGMRSFYFIDDSFYLDKGHALEFCREIVKRKLHVAYRVQTRADVLDKDYTEALSESGCYNIAIGVESGSDLILDKMHKGAGTQTTENAIRNCHKVGIRTEALMIVGNEGETDETIEQTRQFLRRVKPTTVAPAEDGLFMFPGTAVYQKALKEGYVTPDVWETRVRVPVYKYTPEQIAKWSKRIHTHRLSTALRWRARKAERWLNKLLGGR